MSESPSIRDVLRSVFLEAYRHRGKVVIAFVLINVATILYGITSEVKYTSSTTVYVEDRNTLGQLMEGAAVQTGIRDRARIAREVIYGRKIMDKILERQGYSANTIGPEKRAELVDELRGQTVITNVGGARGSLIKIDFTDADQERAYQTTQDIAELFIAESNASQLRESESAFQFIDQQVRDYEEKLRTSEERLKRFRANNETVRPGSEADVRVRVRQLRIELASLEQQLREARIRQNSLAQQVSGAGSSGGQGAPPRTTANEVVRAQLSQQLDNLRLSYYETYPDIIKIKAQIEELDQAIEDERQRREAARAAAGAAGIPYMDESSALNPVTLKLQQDLYATRTEIATLSSRLSESRKLLADEVEKGKLIPNAEARLVELNRDYDVNKGIYEDLLKRREIARVSMNVEREQKGLSLRVDEPAFYPYTPSGLRFWQIALGGLVLGLLIPIMAIYGLQQVDPKVRLLPHLTETHRVPVLGIVPHLTNPREAKMHFAGTVVISMLILATISAIATVAYLRLKGLL